jgi:hypothetical protein
MPESEELHQDIQIIKHEVTAHRQLTKTLLSLQRDELLRQKVEFFMGSKRPKNQLIQLYLAIGRGKTRNELIEQGFRKGTVCRYCSELVNEALLEVKEICPDGQEVLKYTVVEEIAHLSQELEKLLESE